MFQDKAKAIIFSIPKIELILITIFAIALIFAPMVVKGASNSTNGTGFEQTTATWTERTNLSLTTALDGWIMAIGTIELKTNFSTAVSKPQGRIKQNGVVISQVNLTQLTSLSNSVILGASYVTPGTYYLALETSVPSGQKLNAYNWTFMVTPDSGGGISSISGLPVGVLDCTTGETPVCTIIPMGTNFRNDTAKYLQTYVNATFLNITTYSGNYPNSTFAGLNGNYPNSTVASKESTWDAKSVFMNLSVYGQSALTSFARLVATAGINLTQVGTNITIGDNGTNSTITSHIVSIGTNVHGLGNASILNTPFNDSVLQNGSVFVKTNNGSYVLTNNGTYVLTSNGSYVLTSNTSYIKTDNSSYVLVTNTSYVKTNNASYVLVTNTSYVLTTNGSYILTSNNSYVLTNNASYALTSNLTFPRTAVSNGTSGNLTYNSTTGIFNFNTPVCNNATYSKLLSDGTNTSCGEDQTSSFTLMINYDTAQIITGGANLVQGEGITLTKFGTSITIASPAAGVTNATVNPYNMSATNVTSGQMDYIHVRNVSVNLSTNVTSLLPDSKIANSTVWNNKIDSISASGGIVANEYPANMVNLTCTQASDTQYGCLDPTNFTNFLVASGSNVSGVSAQSPLTSSGTTNILIYDNRTAYPNISYQYSSGSIPVNNGTDPIGLGKWLSVGLIPANGTIDFISMIGGDAGAINVSLICNATTDPIYPQDLVTTLTNNPETNMTVSHTVHYRGYCGVYVNSNSGGITEMNIAFMIRRT